jgi:hypothetical protein
VKAKILRPKFQTIVLIENKRISPPRDRTKDTKQKIGRSRFAVSLITVKFDHLMEKLVLSE